MKSLVVWASSLAALGVILSIFAIVMVISESGEGHASMSCNAAVYVAYWPSLLLGVDKNKLFLSLWHLVINSIGWATVGLAFGALKGIKGSK